MKLQIPIKGRMVKHKNFSRLGKLSDNVFILLINVKILTYIGILTFISRIYSCSVDLSMNKIITSKPGDFLMPNKLLILFSRLICFNVSISESDGSVYPESP